MIIAVAVGWGVVPSIGWLRQKEQLAKLETQARDLNSDLRAERGENRSLRETVAPLIKQAAKEFPGEEINSSLKKIVEKLEKENPLKKPIASAIASVEIKIRSRENTSTHFMDQGGFVAFGRRNTAMLMASTHDSFGNSVNSEEVLYRADLSMPTSDSSIGRPVNSLQEAEYIQANLRALPANSAVVTGRVVFVVNGSERLEFPIPPQTSSQNGVFIRDLSSGLKPLIP